MNRKRQRHLYGKRQIIASNDTKERPQAFAISCGNSARVVTLEGTLMDIHIDRRHLFDDREC